MRLGEEDINITFLFAYFPTARQLIETASHCDHAFGIESFVHALYKSILPTIALFPLKVVRYGPVINSDLNINLNLILIIGIISYNFYSYYRDYII